MAFRLPRAGELDRKKKILVKNSVEECWLPILANSRTALHVTLYDIYSLGKEESQAKEKSHPVGPCVSRAGGLKSMSRLFLSWLSKIGSLTEPGAH